MRKKANIGFVLLVSLVVILSGAAILNIAVSSKFSAKTEYERIKNRYIAESGVDLAVGLLINYLSNQDYVLAYSGADSESFYVIDEYSPYLLDEIRLAETSNRVSLDLIAAESADYLSAIGYLDFKRQNGIEIYINTFLEKENFKLSRLCIGPDFLVSNGTETASAKQSEINPLYITVISKYKGGEVLANVHISGLMAYREAFRETDAGEMESVSARIDISQAKVSYENYQNYRGPDI